MKILNNIDLTKNELQNALMHKLASAPSNPVKGQMYYNTTEDKAYIYNGSEWADMTEDNSDIKYAASISMTLNSSTYVLTVQLKDQNGDNIGNSQTIDLPLESVVVSGAYDSTTKEVVLTLQSGSTVRFSVADLVSGLQTEITSSNKLSADLVEDGTTNKVYTATEKTKLSGIESGAEVNDIEGLQVEGVDVTLSGKKFNLKAGTNVSLTVSGNEITVNASSNTRKYSANNPALTASGGLCTWTVTHSLSTSDVVVMINEVTSGEVVLADVVITSSNVVTIKLVSSSNIAADTYKVTVIG